MPGGLVQKFCFKDVHHPPVPKNLELGNGSEYDRESRAEIGSPLGVGLESCEEVPYSQ